jgi:hypothetical protein
MPRTDYLIEQEKIKTKAWLYKLINTMINPQLKKRFDQNLELEKHYLKKQYFYQRNSKKKKKKHQKRRQT